MNPTERDDFVYEKMIAWVEDKFPSLDWRKATEDWTDYVVREGRKFSDWRRAWQSGMKKAESWRVERAAKCGTPTSHSDLLEAIADL